MTISLLSIEAQHIAQALSKPLSDQSPTFALPETWDDSDPPGALAAVGRLRCDVVSSIPLQDLCGGEPNSSSTHADAGDQVGGVDPLHGSELFICRVRSVEHGQGEPLLYYKQQYTGPSVA